MDTQKANVHLRSVVNGEKWERSYAGEYRRTEAAHNIVYTDYTGNTPTKVAVEAAENALLLHRVGAITSDKLFDPCTDTVVKYDALSLRHGFLLHTEEYRVEETEETLCIFLSYVLTDGSGEEEIRGTQTFTITFAGGTI